RQGVRGAARQRAAEGRHAPDRRIDRAVRGRRHRPARKMVGRRRRQVALNPDEDLLRPAAHARRVRALDLALGAARAPASPRARALRHRARRALDAPGPRRTAAARALVRVTPAWLAKSRALRGFFVLRYTVSPHASESRNMRTGRPPGKRPAMLNGAP